MINKAHLNFNLCGRRHDIESNQVHIHPIEVEFQKFGPQCPHVVTGETVEFRVLVKNKSDVELENVIFADPLPRGLEYVPHTFRVDGRRERPHIHRNEISFRFGRLGANCEHEITFGARVDTNHRHEERPGRPPIGRPRGLEIEIEPTQEG